MVESTTAALRILPEGDTASVPDGVALRKALLRAGIPVRGNCGGNGTCGQCRVRVNGEWVLACEYMVSGDATVFVPASSRAPSGRLQDGKAPTTAVSACQDTPATGKARHALHEPHHAALAIDIGTTTLSLSLLALAAGGSPDRAHVNPCAIATRSLFNPQIAFGDDVISRINYAGQNAGGLSEMRDAVIEEINRQTRALLGDPPTRQIARVVVAGNTTMMRILLGLEVESVRSASVGDWAMATHTASASEMGLDLGGDAPVLILPVVSGWVGGDVVAGVLSSGMSEQPETRLLMDLGTNGEMVLGCKDWLVACSCSAGPAFEGGGITWGMPAGPGAIDSVIVDPRTMSVRCGVMGGGPPEGISGSGLVSAVRSMLSTGILDRSGHFTGRWPAVSGEGMAGRIHLATSRWGEEITISGHDVMTVMRAKAAVYAGMKTLEEELGTKIGSVAEVLVAGGFGSSIDIESAVAIGLLPDLPRVRFRVMGNSSLQGAAACAMSPGALSLVQAIARRITYMDLTRHPRFLEQFVKAMFLPHTDLEQFPSQGDGRPGQSR